MVELERINRAQGEEKREEELKFDVRNMSEDF